jgi:hypothetical protein
MGPAMRSKTFGQLPGRMLATALAGAGLAAVTPPGGAGDVPDGGGWSTGAPRDEIGPEFARESDDGTGHQSVLVVEA